MKLYLGTSGYSYKEWKGSFYPEDIKPDKMLNFYSDQLSTVEINTFYRIPQRSVLERWKNRCLKISGFLLKHLKE